jgi:N-methylhydantoinase B/oxoprolinase/acetone carboxylase alpha subunit
MKVIENSDIDQWFKRRRIPSDLKDLSGKYRILDFKGSFTQKKDAAYCLSSCGASGYGDPIERDPENVRRDVMNEYVSLSAAREVYGIVLDEATLEIDRAATGDLRQRMLDKRETE